MKKVIALVDCNNFFVSCERLFNPKLKNKPVCVLSNNDGCVVSRSNEAKNLGVPMGVPYFIAKNQFKNVIFLSGHLSKYAEISNKVMEKLKDYTPIVEVCSIDEAYLDLTNLNKTFNCTFDELIKKIADDIENEIGISISIGLSYSKTLAKLASEKAKALQKKGIDQKTYIIGYMQIKEELKKTDISEICGIGRNTDKLLKKYLIKTAFDFINQNEFWIKKLMGKVGLDLKQELLGETVHSVISRQPFPKSVSRSESFKAFQTDINYIQSELNRHIHKVCQILRDKELIASQIGVFIRTKEFEVQSIKINLINPTNTELEIMPFAKEALNNMYKKGTIYRAVGFWAYKLQNGQNEQISIFDTQKTLKNQKISKTWDKLEQKWGKGVIKFGQVNSQKETSKKKSYSKK